MATRPSPAASAGGMGQVGLTPDFDTEGLCVRCRKLRGPVHHFLGGEGEPGVAGRELAELALNQLQTNSSQIAAAREGLQAKIEQISIRLSTTEHSLAELHTQARHLTAEKLALETRLQQSETKRAEAEQSAARLIADSGQAQTGKKELETQLREIQAICRKTTG